MINEKFAVIGALFILIGSVSYLVDTVKGIVKPNKITWLLWSLAPLIAFFAEIKEGVGLQSLMTFVLGFSTLLIFITSFFNKKAYWSMKRLDLICGLFSLVGLFLWYMTKVGNIAIIFSILADEIAGLPTIIKSYKEPETESPTVYFLTAVGAAITLLTIKSWSFASFAFPLNTFSLDVLLVVLIKFKGGKLLHRRIRGLFS